MLTNRSSDPSSIFLLAFLFLFSCANDAFLASRIACNHFQPDVLSLCVANDGGRVIEIVPCYILFSGV